MRNDARKITDRAPRRRTAVLDLVDPMKRERSP